MKLKIFILAIILSVFSATYSVAQYTIETNILLAPPYPTNLDAYIDYLEEGIIEVNNLSNEAQEVYFSLLFEETSGLVRVDTDGILNEPILMQPGINIFTPQDIESVFGGLTMDNLMISGLSQAEQNAIILNRQMPEGNYRICIQAFNDLGNPLSNPAGGCFDFDVYFAERPIILIPSIGEVIDTFGFIFVNWDHVVNSPGVSERLEYTLKIIDLTEEAINNIELSMLDPAVPTVYEEELGNSYSANLQDDVDIFLEKGHEYAIRVTASDPEESLGFQFGGHSEIVRFVYGELSTGTGEEGLLAAPKIVSPEDEDELELENPTNIVFEIEWDHETDNVKGNLTYSGKLIDMTDQGLEEISMDDMLGEETEFIWEDDGFQKIIILEYEEEELELTTGNTYAALISVESDDPEDLFENDGHSEIITFVLGEAEEGFSLPEITSPIAESYIEKPEIPLTWTHEVADAALSESLSYSVIVIDLTSEKIPKPTKEHFEDENVKKMWDEAIVKKEKILKPTGTQKFTLYNKYAIAIVAESSDEDFEMPNDGYSNIVTFTHGLEPADPDGCTGGDCESSLPQDLTAVAIKKLGLKNKIFKMGDMDMKIDEANGSAIDGYTGEGEIKIGFIANGVRVKVSFENLKVNANAEVIAGTATAMYDDKFENIDKLVSVGASTMLDIDFNAAKELGPALRTANKLASGLSGTDVVSLPFGYDKTEGEETTIVAITKMTFSPIKSEMMALFSLENPDWGEYVPSLGADNICFKNVGFAKQVRLYLSKDYPIGSDGDFILKKTDLSNPESLGTYVELNCAGFKKAQITADIPIDRETLIPVDETGLVIEDETSKVIITVSGTIEPKSNWIFAASATPFEIPGLDGFSVTLQNGFYDSSDRTNPPNFALPDGYTPEENREHWKGVWFEEISITAPRDWGGGSEDVSTKIAMKNFIKDKAGVSINGEAENILSIEKGSYEGFAISMDLLKIDILRNQFKSVSLEGRMGLPILPEDKYLNYKGIVDHGDKIDAQNNDVNNQNVANNTNTATKASMVFTVNVGEESFYIPSLRSNLSFDETTQIIIKNDNKEKGIEALIEGHLAIGDTDGGPDLEPDESVFRFPALKFTDFSLSTIRPVTKNQAETKTTTKKGNSKLKLTAPTFEFASMTPAPEKEDSAKDEEDDTKEEAEEPKVNGFHIGLTEVSMSFGEEGDVDEAEATDGMAMKLKIGGEIAIVRSASSGKNKDKKTKKGGFELSAEGSVTSISRVNKKEGKFTFEFEKISSATLEVDSKMGPIGVKGSLEIYNGDEEFGKGVVGEVEIEVPMLTVDVEARFGNMALSDDESFNYFYLFGKLDIQSGIPIPQTPIKLHRFLGGAYSNMAMKPGAELAETAKEKYRPDSGIAFGFRAGLGFSVASPSTAFATMAFEMSLTDDGGINQITLDGQLDMMQEDPFGDLSGSNFEGIRLKAAVSVLPPRPEVEGRENLKITGDFLAKANLADGTIVGAQEGTELYQIVTGNVEIDGEGFELILGSYDAPGIVRAKLGDDVGLDASFYLQASYGKATDFDEAPVPDFIQRLLNQGKANDQDDFKTSGGDPTAKAAKTHESTGMAMVAGLNLTVGAEIEYSILYASFKAMLGFDMSLKTNKNIVCSNLGGTSMGMGADGYYAKGQVYAGLEGDVGLNVDVFGYQGKIELAYVYAAMLIEGGFANPSWVRGQASMGYRVLGGLVSGNTSFDIQIGEKCEEYTADPFAGVKFIEGIDPDAGKTGVSPFVKPMISFNNKIGRYEFKNGSGQMQYFDVRLESFQISGKYFNKQLAADRLSANLEVTSLKPHTSYTISAKVKVYKLNGTSWVPAISNTTGKEVVEEISHTFKTGAMPDYVPWNNVEDMYPFRNESFYMIEENTYDQGIVKLIGGQAELFKPFTPSGQQWHSKVVAMVWDNTTKTWIHKTDVTYYAGSNIILFKLPKNILNTSTSYAVRLQREWYRNNNYDISGSDIADKKVSTYESSNVYSSYTYKKEGKSYKNATNKQPENKTLFEYWFKTSKYRSFSKKATAGYASSPSNTYSTINFKINNSEGFSEQEIGYKYIAESKSLMKNTAFVKEDLKYFVGAYLVDEYEHIAKRFKKYANWSHSMKVMDNHKFKNDNWKNGFDFFDVPSRKLYTNKNSSQISFSSKAYDLFPSWSDLVSLDFMIYSLVEGSFQDNFKNDFESEYKKLRTAWYDGPWDASNGFWNTDELTESDINYRVTKVWSFLSKELDKENEYRTEFIYSVPYVSNGKFYNRTSSTTSITFKK